MPDKKFALSGQETVTLTRQTVDKLINAGDGDAALLYLYMSKTHEPSSQAEVAASMNKSAGWVATAIASLVRLGLIVNDNSTVEQQPDAPTVIEQEPRRYSVEEIRQEIETSSHFSALLDEAQRSLGKVLTPDDLERLFGIYDSLRLPVEVIMLLITHCIAESCGKGGGRMPSMRYIEKAAYTWEREGIFTLDRAEQYLKALELRKSARGEIKAALHIGDRELSATEKKYVDEWIGMGFGADAAEIAYDRTVLRTGKPAMGYTNSIMKSWHDKGLHTVQEIMEKDGKRDRSSTRGDPRDAKQKFGAPDNEEIERMQNILKKIKEN